MENDFQLACEENEKTAIIDSAKRLNNSLRDFKKQNPTLEPEKMMLLGALSAITALNKDYIAIQEDIQLANNNIEETLTFLKK